MEYYSNYETMYRALLGNADELDCKVEKQISKTPAKQYEQKKAPSTNLDTNSKKVGNKK